MSHGPKAGPAVLRDSTRGSHVVRILSLPAPSKASELDIQGLRPRVGGHERIAYRESLLQHDLQSVVAGTLAVTAVSDLDVHTRMYVVRPARINIAWPGKWGVDINVGEKLAAHISHVRH